MKKLLILLVITSNSAFAQFKQKCAYTVYINYPEYTIKTNVLNTPKKIEVKKTLTYYWYASNKIIETKGGYDGKILDGAYTSFYLSNNLKEKGIFKKGLKNGTWINWYPDGKINEIIIWKKGLKNGISKLYDVKGDLIVESHYKNDQLNGIQTNSSNGKVMGKTTYKNGLEVIKKPKKEKKTAQAEVTTDKPKKKFIENVASVFKKKDKKETTQKSTEETPQKTLKEKFNSLFKKKNKTTGSDTINPNKSTKQSKPQAAK